MNAFKRKSLYTAVVAGLGALAASQASAVNLSTDGTGQVLLYPYYTVRNGYITSFSVVNSNTSHTKAVKVRMLEGKNSAEVLDFNLWLSPRDVWTGSIVDNGTGGAIYSVDNSCTAPGLGRTAATAQPFVNFFYTGQVALSPYYDNGGSSLDRTREGYIEVIEMGVAADGSDAASTPSNPTGSNLASAVKHASTGVPANCARVQVDTAFGNGSDILAPVGGLMGNYIIINSATGIELASTPVALQNFFFRPINTLGALYSTPGDLLPQLGSVSPARSDNFTLASGGVAVATVPDWTTLPPVGPGGQAIDAVSAVLMRSVIMNEFEISTVAPGTRFKTDIVITQPTKRSYVRGAGTTAASALAPVPAVGPYFQTFASATADAARSCDAVQPQAYDREEGFSTLGLQFSPSISAGPGTLCWESTVMTVVPPGSTAAAASVFASANAASLTLPNTGSSTSYANGWVGLWPTTTSGTFNSPGQTAVVNANGSVGVVNNAFGGLRATALAGSGLSGTASTPVPNVRYRGLPVIGFAATTVIIGGQGYGGIFGNKYNVSINTP